MSKNKRLKLRQCIGKKRYESHQEVQVAARAVNRYFQDKQGHYKCQFCGYFHLGHTSFKIRQKYGAI